MQKNAFLIIAIIILVVLGGFYLFSSREQQTACTLEAKICPDGSSVCRVAPNCDFAPCPGEKEGILVSSPKRNETIKSPLIIEGEAKGFWFFEAQFTAELYDAQGNFLGRAILTAQKNWMSEDFVPFEGNLIFTQPQSPTGVLKFLSSNPSGLKENQKVFEVPVQFELIPTQKILLYYYSPEKDKDETGNIKCSKDGLIAIEREIPITQTPIKDTLNLLLKGKQNLTQEDINQGITTEYPLEGFKLKSVNLKSDGTLILEFEDPFNKTIGGSCRVGILWSQIEATAKQFPEVKQVKFLPEELFQP